MKSNSNDRPPILQDLGNGSWHYNYNITEVEVTPEPMAEAEGDQVPAARKAYDYDTVEVWGRPGLRQMRKGRFAFPPGRNRRI